MIVILIICAIFDIWFGFAFMSAGEGAADVVGAFLVIIGIIGIIPIFSSLGKSEQVNSRLDLQEKEYEKFVKGMEILKGYSDMGVTNVYDIADEQERQQIQNINDFCADYIRRQEELQVAMQEKADSDFKTGASIVAGVALGSVLSGAISKHMNESHQRTMERIRKNISRHNS